MAMFSFFKKGRSSGDVAVPLMFNWRRFRFPSFKFCIVLIGVIALHVVAFYLFELASPDRRQSLRNDARVLVLRSSDPMANRVLLAHSEALNVFDVGAGASGKLDSGVRLSPSFDDYELNPLAMPEELEVLEGERFPSLLDGVVTELAPHPSSPTTDRPAIGDGWVAPESVRLVLAAGDGLVFDVPVELDDEFWKANFGRRVSFDLRVDRHGVVTGAIGDNAVAALITTMRGFLIGHRLPIGHHAATAVTPDTWQSWELQLW